MNTFDQKLVEYLNTWTIGDGWPIGNLILCVIALVLCILCVGLIGIEREIRGRSAGLRTHLLVGVGSTIIMIISIYGFPTIFNGKYDVARLAAQVVTGVGFLGAGAIIHRNSGIKGLTTAGTIWVSMAIGIACGSFNFLLAILGTVLIVVVLTVFRKIEVRIGSKAPTFVVTAPIGESIIGKILEISKEFECEVHGVNTSIVDEDSKTMEVIFHAVFSHGKEDVERYVARLEEVIGKGSVHLLNHVNR